MAQVVKEIDGVVSAAGALAVTLTNPGPYNWQVDQISPLMDTAPSGASGRIFKGGAFICDFIPTSDAVTAPPSITLYPGESVSAKWTAATAGDTGKVTFVYDDGIPAT